MKKSVVAIQIDDNNLKIMQGQADAKKWSVLKFSTENITGKTEGDIAGILKDKLHKLKIKKQNIVFVIPRGLATVRYIQLPSTEPAELKNMIDMQIERLIPYTKEEMVYDYYVMGLTAEGFSKVLLTIIHKDVITKYNHILEKAAVTPGSIELGSFSLTAVCKFIGVSGKKLFEGNEPVAILDVDYGATDIVVLQKGSLIFTRAVSIGSTHISGKTPPPPGKDWLNEWIGEINRSLTVFQKEQAISIKKLIVFNNEKLISDISNRLGLPVEKCDIGSYIEGVKAEETAGFSIIGLLGAVREGIETTVNLIPEEIKNRRLSAKKRGALIITVLLVAGILGMLGFTLNKKIQERKEYIIALDNKLRKTSPLAKELDLKKERLAIIKNQLSVEGTSLDILRELYTVIPQKTALNVFVYDDVQGVNIKGVSPAMSEVFDLVPKLENSAYFEKVTTRSATQRKVKGQELTDFQIDCVITVQGAK